jgi:hypothetical protein
MSTTRTLAKIGTVTTAGLLGVCVSAGAAFACNMGTGSDSSAPATTATLTSSTSSTAPVAPTAVSASQLLSLAQGIDHGELTITTSTGTEVVDVQAGTVTTVSPTSVTVTSADGFAGTYLLDPSTKVVGDFRGTLGHSSVTLKSGDLVDIVALQSTGVAQVAKDLSAKSSAIAKGPRMGNHGRSTADWSARGFRH